MREANNCARAIVRHIEEKTGKELALEDCMKIVACIQLAIDTETATAREDSATLDWIEENAHALHHGLDCKVVVRGEDGREFSSDTFRNAVKAARAKGAT